MSQTVSHEIAMDMKAAGLDWRPKLGDSFYCNGQSATIRDETALALVTTRLHEVTWLPTLSDLLMLLERARFRPDCVYTSDREMRERYGRYQVRISTRGTFYGDSREDAAGRAVLHVLKGA